jgi:hypothetical protein
VSDMSESPRNKRGCVYVYVYIYIYPHTHRCRALLSQTPICFHSAASPATTMGFSLNNPLPSSMSSECSRDGAPDSR